MITKRPEQDYKNMEPYLLNRKIVVFLNNKGFSYDEVQNFRNLED